MTIAASRPNGQRPRHHARVPAWPVGEPRAWQRPRRHQPVL